jgi:5'-3' exonuclease
MKILLIDSSHLAHRLLHTTISNSPDDNFDFVLWKSYFINNLFSTIKEFSPDRVIFAIDSSSWRKEVYPLYKSSRASKKNKSKINFERFYPIFEKLLEDFKKTFTSIITLKIDRCESDDIIGHICNSDNFNELVIISSDRDFHQCIKSNVKQYDPISKKFKEVLNPQRELEIKFITGDTNDDIPNIKPKVGPVTALKLMYEGLDELLNSSEQIKKNYERNKILIDFKNIPNDLKEKIMEVYNSFEKVDIDRSKLMNFFVKHRLAKVMESWNMFGDVVKGLK